MFPRLSHLLDVPGNYLGLGQALLAVALVAVDALTGVGALLVSALGPVGAVVQVEHALVDIDTVVLSVALVPLETLTRGLDEGLGLPVDDALGLDVTLLVSANVVDALFADFRGLIRRRIRTRRSPRC